MSKNVKRYSVLFLTLCMLFSIVCNAYAEEPNVKHWAYETLQKWKDLNLLKGDANGDINQDNLITRAEFVTFVNKVFNFKDEALKTFPDVSSNKWYAVEISKAYNAGILAGDENGNMNPEAGITRQEAAAILTRVFKLKVQDNKAYEGFNDSMEVSPWAQVAVSAMKEKGYIKGRGNNNFAPTDKTTRAEAIVMINNTMGRLINKAGTYSGDSNGNVIVSVKDVNIENMNIGDSLYLTPGIGEGDVNINNVNITEDVYVDGGGGNSIHINDSTVNGRLIVNKSKVRVVISSNSGLEEIEVTEIGAGGTIKIEEGSTISNIVINGVVTLEGIGNIERIEINVDGVTLKQKPENIILAEGIKVNIGGIEVTGGKNGELVYPTTPTQPTQPTTPTQPTNPVEPEEPYDGNLNIVKDGRSSYSIVIPDTATKVEASAAGELQHYIKEATGVNLNIVRESEADTRAIMIGATDFAQTNNVTPEGEEDWIIKGFEEKLVLTGGETRGVLYSVYHFLEDIVGVRWWNPWGEEYIPQVAEIILAENFEDNGSPSFIYRDIYDGLYDVALTEDGLYGDVDEPSLFYVRNRINGHFSQTPAEYGGTYSYGPPYHVHTFASYFPTGEYFEEHPEWYSYSKEKGERISNGQLCLTNEVLLQEFINKVKECIRISYAEADAKGEPRPIMFSVTQNDWRGGCQCDECSQIIEQKGESGHILTFVNKIADAIKDDYPEAKIETLAYWFYIDPPKDDTKPNDNVVIRLADIENRDILHSLNHRNNIPVVDKIQKWSELCDNDNLFIWDYAVDYRINPPFPTVFKYGEDYKLYHENNVKGLFIEQEDPITQDIWNLNLWVQTKLMEDVNRDVNELIDEFIYGYYGVAGDYIKQYLLKVRDAAENSDLRVIAGMDISMNNYISLDLAIEGTRLFELAVESVKGDPVFTRRVNHIRSCLDKAIVLKYNVYANEAKERGIFDSEFNLNRRESAQRVVSCLREQLELMCQHTNEEDHKFHCTTAKRELAQFQIVAEGSGFPLPDELKDVPSEGITDFTPDTMRLAYMPGEVLTIVEDNESVVKKAAKLSLNKLDPTNRQLCEGDNLYIGVYNPATGGWKKIIQIKPEEIIPGEYKLFKISYEKIPLGSYLFIFGSWIIQQDMNFALSSDPDQLYDIYVSMKFEGASYGGDAAESDAIYVNRIIVVQKDITRGSDFPLPEALKDVPSELITDFTPEIFKLEIPELRIVDDEESQVEKAVKLNLNDIDPEKRKYYEGDNLYIGMYTPATGVWKKIIQVAETDITPGKYMLLKAEDVNIPRDSFLFVYSWWSIQQELNYALSNDPDQLYDIYVSMKFEGASYGGNASEPDAIYVNRIIVVEKNKTEGSDFPLPEALKDVPSELITDFKPETFRLEIPELRIVDDEQSQVEKAVKLNLNDIDPEKRKYYEGDNLYVGIYTPATGAWKKIIQVTETDITPGEYMLLKAEDANIPPDSYLFVFGWWSIQQELNYALSNDPDQLYDIYVSMKFEGASYGGNVSEPDAIYVNRIIVVEKQ